MQEIQNMLQNYELRSRSQRNAQWSIKFLTYFGHCIIAICLLLLLSNTSQAQTFLSEGFESITKPTGWSEVKSGLATWRYQNGGHHSSGSTYNFPATAHTGTKNAILQYQSISDHISKLVTPSIDLRYSIKPVLTFWHAQDAWNGNTDQLRVYYRKSTSSTWVLLEEYILTLENWTQRTIVLPIEAKTAGCQLAFEGTTKSGFGVCLDDVIIEDKGILPRQVESINLTQLEQPIPTGLTCIPLGYINITVKGNNGTLPITSLTLNYTGTSTADISPNGVKLYYTKDTVFFNNNVITATGVSISDGKITFSGLNLSLQTGVNYLWICCDINENATPGNKVDFSLNANSLTIGSGNYPSTTQSPTQSSTLEKSIISNTFELPKGWNLTGIWQEGTPTGAGEKDPLIAFSGTKILATNLNGNYPANISDPNTHTVITPSANCKYYKNLNVKFKQWLNVESSDYVSVAVSSDDGITWKNIRSFNNIADAYWKNMQFDISDTATRKSNVRVKFAIDETDANIEFGGWNIDNFALTGKYIAQDLSLMGHTQPTVHCGMGLEPVSITIKNTGGNAILVPYEVGYSLDNGITFVKESINHPLNSEEEFTYTFTQKADLSVIGSHHLIFQTFLANDDDNTNDKRGADIFIYPQENLPYATSFEQTNSYWHTSGENSTWTWGIPTKANITAAADGTKVWITGIKYPYQDNENSYIESPCFNLTGINYPLLSFYYKMETDIGIDGFKVEYSINDGKTWQIVPASNDYMHDWNPSATVTALASVGWSKNTTEYQRAFTLLPAEVKNAPSIKLRFAFASNESANFDGVAIDAIKLFELPLDPGIKSMTSPTTSCLIGNNKPLTLEIQNYGAKPIVAGTTIPIKVKVDNGEWKTETITLATTLNKNSSINYSTTSTFDFRIAGDHTIKAYLNLDIDNDRTNDTLSTTVKVTGMPTFTLGPDIGTLHPETVILDAGPNMASYKWQDNSTNRTFNVSMAGTYTVIVTNAAGCSANASVTVLNSDKNTGVTNITGLSNACNHSATEKPTISVKNYGINTLIAGYKIPIAIDVNRLNKSNEEITLTQDLAPNAEILYTLVNGIDLSGKGAYRISIATNLTNDINRSNDTTTLNISTWGLPLVVFQKTEIATTKADTVVLKAGAGFSSYLWKNVTANTIVGDNSATYSITSLFSATYSVTVTEANGCGETTATVSINAKDLAISVINKPEDNTCENSPLKITATLKNNGQDEYPNGTQVTLNWNTPEKNKQEVFTLTAPLTAGNSVPLTFTDPITLSSGSTYIQVSVAMIGDINSKNNSSEKALFVHPAPSVKIEPDTLFRAFLATDSYTIIPTYSNDVTGYLWQDGQVSYTYSILGYPLFNKYIVTGKTEFGCSAKDSLVVIPNDLELLKIVSPVSKCILENNTPITITVKNSGNTTYTAGTKITIKANLNGTNLSPEYLTLTTDLAPQASTDYTLTQKANLAGQLSFSLEVTLEEPQEFVINNNTLNKTGYETGIPTVSLGADEVVHAWEKVLTPGSNFNTYLWQDNSIKESFTATQTGNYSVTVTDYNGCSGSDEVHLTFMVDDITLVSLDSPKSGCNLTGSEPVTITIKNSGTTTLPIDQPITINYTMNGSTHSETVKLASELLSNNTQQITLTGTMDFTTKKVYPIEVWIDMANDMHVANNKINTTVEAYSLAIINLGPDIVQERPPYTLNAGSGFSSYLWNTGASSPTLEVTTSGNYSVTVINPAGCSASDEINVTFVSTDITLVSLDNPKSSCSLTTSEPIKITVKNIGSTTLPAGQPITVNYTMDGTPFSEPVTLASELLPNTSRQITLTATMNFAVKKPYSIEVSVEMVGDMHAENNKITTTVEAYAIPLVDLGADIVQENPPYTLNAQTSPASYLWNTGATTQTLEVTTSGKYSVTVTNLNGCTAFDEINIHFTSQTLVVTNNLISPISECVTTDPKTITIELQNNGLTTYTAGTSIAMGYKHNTADAVSEMIVLKTDLAPGSKQTIDFTQKVVSSAGTNNLKIYISKGQPDEKTFDLTYSSKATPTFQFTNNKLEVDKLPYNLIASGGNSYLWSNGDISPNTLISSPGIYWVQVSLTNGCSIKATIEIIKITSAEESEFITSLKYYPVPASYELNVEATLRSFTNVTIEIVDIAGIVIWHQKYGSVDRLMEKIPLTNIKPGTYILRIQTPDGNSSSAFIINR